MNPDLRAIEAALFGESCEPSGLSPEAAFVVLPLVRLVVRERDDGRHEIDRLRRERHAERQRVQERDAEIAEMRLTLAAEQGRAEGAPSEVWRSCVDPVQWGKVAGGTADTYGIGTLVEQVWERFELRGWRWTCSQQQDRGPSVLIAEGIAPTARAAMIAADKALFESRRSRCLAKVRQLQSDGVILYPPNGTHQQTPAIMIDRLSVPDLTEAVLAIYEKALFA